MQYRAVDFNKKLMGVVSDFTLQITFKKLPLLNLDVVSKNNLSKIKYKILPLSNTYVYKAKHSCFFQK